MKRSECLGDSGQETVEKVNAAEETLQFHFRRRPWHRSDGVHFGWERHYTSGVHEMSKVFHGGRGEDTLLLVEVEPSITESAEDLMEVPKVLIHVGAGDQNVVQVDENTWKAAEDTVHEPLERLG